MEGVRRSSRISKKEKDEKRQKKSETVITVDDFPSPPPVRARRSTGTTTPKKRKVAEDSSQDSSSSVLSQEDNSGNDHLLPPIFSSKNNVDNNGINNEKKTKGKKVKKSPSSSSSSSFSSSSSSSSSSAVVSPSDFNLVSSEAIKEALSSLQGRSARANFNKILSVVGGEPEVVAALVNDSRFSDSDFETAKRLSFLSLTSSAAEEVLHSFITVSKRIDSKHDEQTMGLIKLVMSSYALHDNDHLLEDLLCVYLAKTSRYLQLHKPSNTVVQPFLDVVFHFVGTRPSSSSSSSLLINSLKEVISSSSFTKETSLFMSSLVERTLSPKWLPCFPPQQEMRTLLNWIWISRWSKKHLGSMYLDRYTIVKKLIPGITPTVESVLKKALKTSSSSLEDLVSGLLTVDDEKFEALTQAIGLLKKRKRSEGEREREEEGAAGVFFVDTRRNPTSIRNQEELQRKKNVVNPDDETSLEQELGELIGNLKSTEQEEDDE